MKPQDFLNTPLVLPPKTLHDQLVQIVRPMLALGRRLRSENEQLVQVRDRLLPKLVTGEIDVSGLDLDAVIAEGMAG